MKHDVKLFDPEELLVQQAFWQERDIARIEFKMRSYNGTPQALTCADRGHLPVIRLVREDGLEMTYSSTWDRGYIADSLLGWLREDMARQITDHQREVPGQRMQATLSFDTRTLRVDTVYDDQWRDLQCVDIADQLDMAGLEARLREAACSPFSFLAYIDRDDTETLFTHGPWVTLRADGEGNIRSPGRQIDAFYRVSPGEQARLNECLKALVTEALRQLPDAAKAIGAHVHVALELSWAVETGLDVKQAELGVVPYRQSIERNSRSLLEIVWGKTQHAVAWLNSARRQPAPLEQFAVNGAAPAPAFWQIATLDDGIAYSRQPPEQALREAFDINFALQAKPLSPAQAIALTHLVLRLETEVPDLLMVAMKRPLLSLALLANPQIVLSPRNLVDTIKSKTESWAPRKTLYQELQPYPEESSDLTRRCIVTLNDWLIDHVERMADHVVAGVANQSDAWLGREAERLQKCFQHILNQLSDMGSWEIRIPTEEWDRLGDMYRTVEALSERILRAQIEVARPAVADEVTARRERLTLEHEIL